MATSKKKTIRMSYEALSSYILNTNYRSFSGISGLIISFGAILLLIFNWGDLSVGQRGVFLLVGIMFTIINPVMLSFKAFRQLKLSPSYKKPLVYEFLEDGIEVSLGDQHQKITWDMICRVMMTKSMIAIFTSRVHAFVIPLKELGDDKGKIVTSIVQFTAEYKPMLSKNLKEYRSGKGFYGK